MYKNKFDSSNDINKILLQGSLAEVKQIPREEIRNYCGFAGLRALHYAVKNSDAKVVEYLLNDIKLSPNLAANNGTMPIIMAATLGNMEIVKLLIYSGAEYECKDITGKTVREILYYAKGKNLEQRFDDIVKDYKLSKENSMNNDNAELKQSSAVFWRKNRTKSSDNDLHIVGLNNDDKDAQPLLADNNSKKTL